MQEWLDQLTGLDAELGRRFITGVAVILVLVALQRLLSALIGRVGDPHRRYQWRKLSLYLVFVAGLLIVGRIWFAGLQAVATFFGLLTAGLAIALQEPIVNLAGWLFIVFRRPFSPGDRIQLGPHRGDVVDVRLFQFSLLEIGHWVDADQPTGRIIHVPNAMVFREPLANYSRGIRHVWHELPVLVTFESDWEKAKALLQEFEQRHSERLTSEEQGIIDQFSRRFAVPRLNFEPTVYTSVRESGILLTVRFVCEPRRRRDREQTMWEAILREFARHDDIDFAYPTQRLYNARTEGKQAIAQDRAGEALRS